jgi:hypothetical protein
MRLKTKVLVLLFIFILNPTLAINSSEASSKITNKKVLAVMQECIKKNASRSNSGPNIIDSNYLQTTMAILSDCIERKDRRIVCAPNDRNIYVCGTRGRHVGYSLPAVMGSMSVRS